jgi:hypothetical protein
MGASLLGACSSSSSGSSPDASLFGTPDTGGSSSSGQTTSKNDTSAASSHHDAAAGTTKDGGCGTTPATDWCTTNAPVETKNSNVQCDDFDVDDSLNMFGYTGVTAASWISGDYVSPYCALQTFVGDGGAPSATPARGSYTEHAYPVVPGSGGLSLAFDVHVPTAAACNGVTVARVWVSTNDSVDLALKAWLKITNIMGNGDATAFTLELLTQSGTQSDGGSGGALGSAVTVDVSPNKAGWARLAIDVGTYSISANSGTITATGEWYTPGDTAVAGKTPSETSSGNAGPAGGEAEANMDVGVIPDPTTGIATSGCAIVVDDFVSNVLPSGS